MRYRRHPNTAARKVQGEAFVITGDDNKLHRLNPTATLVWELAEEGFSLEDAAAELHKRFAVDEETAAKDISVCADDFVARGILVADK